MALEFGHAPGPGGPCVLGALCVLASAGDFTVTVTVFCLSYYSEYGFICPCPRCCTLINTAKARMQRSTVRCVLLHSACHAFTIIEHVQCLLAPLW